MFLSQIKIKNFRLFKEFELVLNPTMNLIVGENNSGKTSLIDAIRYALGTTSGERILVSENDFYKNESNFHIQLKFDNISSQQASVFVEHLTHEPIDKDKRKSVLYINYEATLTTQVRRGYRYIKTEIKSGKNVDGIRIEKEIRDYLSVTYLKPLRDAEAEMIAGRGSRLSQILSAAGELAYNSNNFQEIVQTLTSANSAIAQNDGVTSNREKITNHLKGLTFENEQFRPVIDILDGKDPSQMTEPEKWRLFKSILEKFNLLLDGESPIQGLGYNNILFIATELLLLQQEENDFTFLIIEEPEAHLHPQLQMKLLKFIRNNYNKEGQPKLQSIMTTHSANLASKAPLESVILMTKNGKAFPLRKGETDLDDTDYVFLEKFLDVTKSNLFFAKAVLIVEGDAENILLPTISELLGRPLENYGVSIVNVGSAAFARYAKIFRRKLDTKIAHPDSWIPIKVACVRDLDLWPAKAEKMNGNNIGYKERKQPNEKNQGGNLSYWENYYDADNLATFKKGKKELEDQHVKVFVSDKWTFEYCLVLKGLAKEVYEAIHPKQDSPDGLSQDDPNNFDQLSQDDEEKAIQIYKEIDEGNHKTKVAYELAKILTRDYQAKNDDLRRRLPEYIVKAIEYVTEPLSPVN